MRTFAMKYDLFIINKTNEHLLQVIGQNEQDLKGFIRLKEIFNSFKEILNEFFPYVIELKKCVTIICLFAVDYK